MIPTLRFPSDGTNSHAPQLTKHIVPLGLISEAPLVKCPPAELIGNQAVAGKDPGDASIGNPAKRKTATQQPRPVLVCRSRRSKVRSVMYPAAPVTVIRFTLLRRSANPALGRLVRIPSPAAS